MPVASRLLRPLVLVGLTAYYAWASRALVRETRAALGSPVRATLQARMDKISELLIWLRTLRTLRTL
jgi:hypothetical protein